jgi:hypothetical protein
MERDAERNVNRGCAVPGNAGRPTAAQRRARIESIAETLAAEFGGLRALSATERLLVTQAAELTLRRPNNAQDAVRLSNATQRIIARLGKRKRAPATVPLRERLALEAERAE